MLRIIDKNTLVFKRDDFVFDTETEIGLDAEPAQGLWLPKAELDSEGNFVKWVEGGTKPIDNQSFSEKLIAMIREKYTIDDEFALINKGITNCTNQDYLTYREYVNECKSKAKI